MIKYEKSNSQPVDIACSEDQEKKYSEYIECKGMYFFYFLVVESLLIY